MFPALLSDDEKTYICGGIEHDARTDGRTRSSYRPIELETDVVPHANGSARIRLAHTDILVAVKAETDTPPPESVGAGKLEFFVDCSANATPAFEGRGGDDLASEISSALQRGYGALPLHQLCILPMFSCWKMHVDILILECGGNLFDAVSLAVKSALYNTRIPKVTGKSIDGAKVDLQLSDDLYDCWRLDVAKAPVLVTVCKIGDYFVVDPTIEEEVCSNGSIVAAVTDTGIINGVFKTGEGSFHHNAFVDAIEIAKSVGIELNRSINTSLKDEENLGIHRERFGFLK